MTDSMTAAIEDATAAVAAIEDPVARFEAARVERATLATGDRLLLAIQREIVRDLHEGRSWAEVGALLGFSGSRAEAIARER
ncbi:hypothetical protein ADK53_28670 [Streptomyces sp. WM6373]|jgi:signal transduction histidine kinase|uniref:hypothetical protein n=1 Tax=Streptomyces sp. WM6373 TaxID=1415556 RepID=UPI0006AF0B21|nr:hypothetical protein [Streptomyces sp. WM6373]KOU30194.1 hypothetical protein ADK53_28670 [Streptomyces sp. WM6373]